MVHKSLLNRQRFGTATMRTTARVGVERNPRAMACADSFAIFTSRRHLVNNIVHEDMPRRTLFVVEFHEESCPRKWKSAANVSKDKLSINNIY